MRGIRLHGQFLPAPASQVKPGKAGLVYARPEGVRRVKSGIPASLAFCAFEAGKYRAYWRIAGVPANLCSHESAPPPVEARLAICPDHILVYPKPESARP